MESGHAGATRRVFYHLGAENKQSRVAHRLYAQCKRFISGNMDSKEESCVFIVELDTVDKYNRSICITQLYYFNSSLCFCAYFLRGTKETSE